MKAIFMGACLWVFMAKIQAQKVTDRPNNGVYLTVDDYIHHRLVHEFNDKREGFNLRTPRMNRIKIKTPDSTYQYDLTTVFGYRQAGRDWCYRSGELVEIIGYKSLELLSYEGLWLYRRRDWSELSPNYTYFFSKHPTGELSWVSRKKVKEAYKKDTEFMSLLNQVRWSRILDTSSKTGRPLLLDIYAVAHQLHFSLKDKE